MKKRYAFFPKIRFRLGLFTALAVSSLSLNAQTYSPVAVTGFNADVIANGSGSAASSTSVEFDGSGYNLVAQNFVSPSNQTPAGYLPANGIINSAATPGLSYQLASYSGNNTLKISGGPGSGTLTFTNPTSASNIFVLGTSVYLSIFDATINFTDNTSQTFSNLTMERWMAAGVGTVAIQGIGKVVRATSILENPSPGPSLYQITLTPNAANAQKLIQSITFTKTSPGTGERLHIMAISKQATVPSVANDAGITAITAPNSGCLLSSAETITATVLNNGTTALSNVPVSYKINNGTPVNEVIAGPIAPYATLNYSFTTKANLSTAGTYNLEVRTNLAGDLSAANDSMTSSVVLSAIPVVPTISTTGPAAFCSGSSVTLTAASATPGVTYQWFNNGSAITNATGSSYNATAVGSYTVVATSTGCSSAASAATTVTVNTLPPAPGINVSGSLAICTGDSVVLTASSSVAGVTFTWFKNGNIIPGATAANYMAKTAGNYTVTATNNGCASPASLARTVTTKQSPATPTITQNGNLLTSSSTSGNQWYKNGTVISGATTQTLNASANGTYTVKVTANGCASASSNAVVIVNSGIKEALNGLAVSLYPNPATGLFYIELPKGKLSEITITDFTGKVVKQVAVNSGNTTINISGFAKGIYFLQIVDDDKTATRKLVVK